MTESYNKTKSGANITTDFHTYEGLCLFPEAVFGCSCGLSAGCSTVRVRGHWSAGGRDGPGDGQEELNVIVGQTDVQGRKLNLSKNHIHNISQSQSSKNMEY